MTFHSKSKPNKEIQAICRLQSLLLSRAMTILLLLAFIFFFGYTSLYVAVVLLCFPGILQYAILAKNPSCNENYLSNALLPETLKENHFRYSSYRAETICFYIIIVLFVLWQLTMSYRLWYGIPVWRTPSVLLLLYIAVSQFIYLCLKIKLHHQFRQLNMD